mmetsp:Transcript_39080/g.72353  ORF Transcript_39080/g.72353 Transcript_39080/m.72353 type:complete len:210 (-) Transcript_39080:119-748(-)
MALVMQPGHGGDPYEGGYGHPYGGGGLSAGELTLADGRVGVMNNEGRFSPTRSLRLSCKSDQFDGSNMAGMILWSYRGQTDWRLGGVHCKSGYVYVKKSENVQHVQSNMGQIHGKLYKHLFKCEPNVDGDCDVLATGFAFKDGRWSFKSGVFNRDSSHQMRQGSRKATAFEEKLVQNFMSKRYAPGCNIPIAEFAPEEVIAMMDQMQHH